MFAIKSPLLTEKDGYMQVDVSERFLAYAKPQCYSGTVLASLGSVPDNSCAALGRQHEHRTAVDRLRLPCFGGGVWLYIHELCS